MRALLAEPDRFTAESLEMMLAAEDFGVHAAEDGEEAIDLLRIYDYDVAVLELALSDISGFEVLRRVRGAKVKTPILVLSGLAGIQDKVKALRLGADDFLAKPFHKDELVARILAIVRRSRGLAGNVAVTGDLAVDLEQRTVTVAGADLHVTNKEFGLLELLSLRKGAVVTRETILNRLYGGLDEPEAKIVDVFFCKLRKKLARASGGRNYIETVWGRGYRLSAPAAREVEAAAA
jgi:two-component system, cell cycle response regulator CtrA